MNNLKYYNDSLAYDFDLFLPKEKPVAQPKENIIKMPVTKKQAKKHTRSQAAFLSSGVSALIIATALVVALCGTIALRIGVNELNSQVNKAKTQLNTLQSECVALQMEYENRVSYTNLEAEATALGMKKLDKNQVVYIRVNDKSMAKTGDGKTIVAK